MSDDSISDFVGQEVTADTGSIALLNKSEIEQQITTAHRYPRSVVQFRKEALQMVTLTETIAQECIYALPRDGKVIEGPSARFAEVINNTWGNCIAGARVISDSGDFVTSQGAFHDLQKNAKVIYEVQRRITNKNGKRYSPDMIGVTANAACSIALRNAILKGVPKAFWSDIYMAARKVVAGDFKTLANKRAEAIKQFQMFGINEKQIFEMLGKQGIQDISMDDLVTLHGVLTAIKEGDTTPEQAFAPQENPTVDMPQSKSKKAETPAPTPSPTPEAPAAPAKAKSNDANLILATAGEKGLIASKAAELGLSIDEVMNACGITDFKNLTKDGFVVLHEFCKEQSAH